ncbi:MAG: addiction module protein [Pirellulaceae bacterium]|nr:addiction module protein [Pirellulaceae bacterium]
MDTIDNIRSQALGLTATQRAALAHDLLISLEDEEPDADAASAWAEEIEARSAAYAAGEIEASDWRESLARSKAAFEQERTK